MSADVYTLPSRNPHVSCALFPCPRCRAKRDAEQEARDRHPAGSDHRDVMPASGWMLTLPSDDGRLHVDMVDVDSELIEDLAQACAEWQYANEQGRTDIDLGIAADKIRDLLTVTLNRPQALAIAMALQNHASRMEVTDA